MLLARIVKGTAAEQTLLAHAENVACYAAENARSVGLEALLRLSGLLHDAGKASSAFQIYLLDEDAQRGTVEHSAYGAIYAYQRWHSGGAIRMLASELVAFAIASHHGRLPDLLDEDGGAFSEDKLTALRFNNQDEVMALFFAEIATPDELDALFEQAAAEVERAVRRIDAACAGLPPESLPEAKQNLYGLMQRSVYGILIDADRWDAYRFEAGLDAEQPTPPPWPLWQQRLEDRLAGFGKDTAISRLRAGVSEECLSAAEHGAGVYRLCVPTGGGKTYASMRYALEAAKRHGFTRILYVAPYKTILEQTAKDVRGVFEGAADDPSELILEHHGDALPDDEPDGQALRRYQLLSQRWNVPLVLTTMVQLLQTLFSGASACARRFAALSGSVLIVDEAQSLPLRCMELFNLALRYLAGYCGCAVVLCTATQPLLDEAGRFPLVKPVPMIADEAALHIGFKRVQALDMTSAPLTAEELATRVISRLPEVGSALCIANTKATATGLYQAFRALLPEDMPLYCLTTAQCPAHRLCLLDEVRALLAARRPVVCVATQLIEAGVDVSFGLAVRALAGLDSVAQAAGRCNRHAERPLGELWLVRVAGERLTQLRDIRIGQEETLAALDAYNADPSAYGGDLLSPRLVEAYFRHILRVRQGEMAYPLDRQTTLVDLLCANRRGRGAYRDAHAQRYTGGVLAQAFRTAGRAFSALDASPFSLLTPYGKGAELIAALDSTSDLRQAAHLLRSAQRYTVSVFPYKLAQFKGLHCVRELPGYGCYALDARYYDDKLGLSDERKEMELLDI